MKIQEIIEPLTESKGLFGRKVGDTFTDDNGEKARFEKIMMYPEDEKSYADIQACDAAKKHLEKETGLKILWVNAHGVHNLAFAIAQFTLDNGETMLWGRHYRAVPNNVISSWSNKETPGTWTLQTKSATKMRTGLTPQDLIGTDKKFSGIEEIMSRVTMRMSDKTILDGFSQLIAGSLPVFRDQASNMEAIRDYLGEIMQPIALIQGMVKGDADKAREECLGMDWNQCSVVWPQSKNTNLIDSVFIAPRGNTLGISSKGNKGANASSGNIWSAIEKARRSGKTDLMDNYTNVVEIIEIINGNSAVEGPIKLGQRFGMCDDALATEIRRLVTVDQTDVSKLSTAAQKLFNEYGSRPEVSGYRFGYVLLANLAKKVSAHVNQVPEFGEGCLAFLNQASILQVYTTAKVVKNDVHITGFKSIYPATFDGSVYLDAGKNYCSNRVSGKISFKYGANKPAVDEKPAYADFSL